MREQIIQEIMDLTAQVSDSKLLELSAVIDRLVKDDACAVADQVSGESPFCTARKAANTR